MSEPEKRFAPGWPGIQPRWTSSAKTGVGTALSLSSRVWFTISHGILNEVYYPRVDQACIRDLGLLVTNGVDYFSEEKRHCRFKNVPIEPGIPVYELTNTEFNGRYQIEKEVFTDPFRNVVLQRVRFVPLKGKLDHYRLYALLAPHLANFGAGNTGWTGDYKGELMLFAERDRTALAFGCSTPWRKMSVGFVGFSDGWQDLAQHYRITWEYTRAENGNIALIGEVDLASCQGEFILALGFGEIWSQAGQQTRSSLRESYERLREHYVIYWREWLSGLLELDEPRRERDLYRASATALRTHESKDFLGGVIASLSIPWGYNKGDEDLGGYHVVWPRDLVETAFGFLAAGASRDARRVLRYLESTQEADGHWAQNMWLDGRPYWDGVQMDETAFPILLVDRLRRDAVEDVEPERWWGLVRRAAGFLVRNGPVTEQDRWEEDAGYSPFTLAVEISALLAAADLAEAVGEKTIAGYLRDIADTWNDNIERWTYATGTEVARQIGVEGYYVRIAPPEGDGVASPLEGFVPIKNRPPGQSSAPATHLISTDALALVRFGLRAPDDPRILNTLKVIDALLRVQLPQGFCWYRYNGDGYGEHEDGSPFDGSGIGRPWPLLAGERAHYELAAGHESVALELLKVMEFSTEGSGRLLPEQVWDGPDLPEPELFTGKPSGSACPLVWAHSEYIKLRRSLRDRRIFDQPPQPRQRYVIEKRKSPYFGWRFNNKCQRAPRGKILRIVLRSPALVHWSFDDWRSTSDIGTRDAGLGTHVADLPSDKLAPGQRIVFTFYWLREQRWEGLNYHVVVEA